MNDPYNSDRQTFFVFVFDEFVQKKNQQKSENDAGTEIDEMRCPEYSRTVFS